MQGRCNLPDALRQDAGIVSRSFVSSRLLSFVETTWSPPIWTVRALTIQLFWLQWGTKAARQFRVEEGDFDMLLACDCVFPPVYGESWFLLVDTFHEFLSKGGNPVALISWERRKSDKYDEFVSYCASKSPALQLDRVLLEEPISIYSITIA